MTSSVRSWQISWSPVDVDRLDIANRDIPSSHDGQLAITGRLVCEFVYARAFKTGGDVCAKYSP